MGIFQDAKLKADVWLRERKQRAEEKKAERVDPPGVTVPAWLVRSAHFAGWIAYCALMYFLWERVLDVSEAQHSSLEVTHFGVWSNLDLTVFFPLIIGYIFVVIGVPYVAKIAIPILVSLSWRDAFWPKLTALIITILVSVVLITGTATVGSNAIIESERSAAVAVEQVQQERTGIQSQIDRKERELQALINHRNTYFSIAASMTPEAYRRNYIEARRDDPNIERLRSALGASEDAARLRADIAALEDQRDQMQTTAAVSSEVVTARTQTLNSVMDALNTFWVLMLAVVMDLACLFMPWIAMRLEQTRNAQLARMNGVEGSGWAPKSHRIEDHSDEDPITSQPMRPAREVVTDAETGEELIKITPKPHWRKAKGKKQKLAVQPDIPPDETGVEVDGGNRTAAASVAAVLSEPKAGDDVGEQPAKNESDRDDAVVQPDPNEQDGRAEEGNDGREHSERFDGGIDGALSIEQPEPSTELAPMSDEELLTLPEFASNEERTDERGDHTGNQESHDGHGDQQDATDELHAEPHHERTEPEQDERKLIAAE